MYAKLIIKRFEASMTVEHDENKQSRMKGLTRGQEWEHEHEYEYEKHDDRSVWDAGETNCIFAAREKPVFRMVSDIQKKKKDRESLSNDLNREKKLKKTSHLLTLLPEKSCKETFLDAVTSRILVVWFSTSISLVPFLLPSLFLHYVFDVTS